MEGLENNISMSTLLEKSKNPVVNKRRKAQWDPWCVLWDSQAHAHRMVEMEKGA